jgi:hypothetical protein
MCRAHNVAGSASPLPNDQASRLKIVHRSEHCRALFARHEFDVQRVLQQLGTFRLRGWLLREVIGETGGSKDDLDAETRMSYSYLIVEF